MIDASAYYRAAESAESLEDMRRLLIKAEDEMATKVGLAVLDGVEAPNVEMAVSLNLPNFGGEPIDTDRYEDVMSWDESRVLVSDDENGAAQGWVIVERDDFFRKEAHDE